MDQNTRPRVLRHLKEVIHRSIHQWKTRRIYLYKKDTSEPSNHLEEFNLGPGSSNSLEVITSDFESDQGNIALCKESELHQDETRRSISLRRNKDANSNQFSSNYSQKRKAV